MTTETSHRTQLFIRRQAGDPEVYPFAGGQVAACSLRSPVKETDNEDAAALIRVDDERGILAVADGVGGQRSGAVAAEIAVGALAECIETPLESEDGSLRSSILNGLEQANRQVTELAVGAATTLAVVEVDGAAARPYHVGDSMILVVGQRGKVRLQTVSHSPVGYALEAGLLDETEAIHHEDRHLVSNIVGSPDMRIEVGPVVALRRRDTLVVGTDGLFDNLHVAEIVELIRKGPLPLAAARLADAARRRMSERTPEHPSKPDDMTFLVYRPRVAARRGEPPRSGSGGPG